jgi:hypothetical protein
MEKIMPLLSFFILPIIVFYGFALMLGKTKEANRAVKKVAQAVFQFIIDVVSSVVVFAFRKLRELHRYCYQKHPLATWIIELLLIATLLLIILFK